MRPGRLRKSQDIARVYQHGESYANALLRLKVLRRGPDRAEPRAAIVTSAKVGKAVTRNRVRRRLREIIRLECEPAYAVDMVVTAKPAAADADFRALERAAVALFGRAGLRRALRANGE